MISYDDIQHIASQLEFVFCYHVTLNFLKYQNPRPSHQHWHNHHHHPHHNHNHHQRIAGDESIGFKNSVFLPERASADRNFSMGYFMKVVMMLCYDDDDNADYDETPSKDRIFLMGFFSRVVLPLMNCD